MNKELIVDEIFNNSYENNKTIIYKWLKYYISIIIDNIEPIIKLENIKSLQFLYFKDTKQYFKEVIFLVVFIQDKQGNLFNLGEWPINIDHLENWLKIELEKQTRE